MMLSLSVEIVMLFISVISIGLGIYFFFAFKKVRHRGLFLFFIPLAHITAGVGILFFLYFKDDGFWFPRLGMILAVIFLLLPLFSKTR